MIKEISVYDLKDKIDNNENFILLDVREKHELDICQIDGSLHIPMSTLPERLSEIDLDSLIVLMCHTGVRSAHVCQYLVQKGYDSVNLSGGIDSWSVEIDQEMKRY